MKRTSLFFLAIAALAVSSSAYGDTTINHLSRGAFNFTNGLTGDWKITGGSYQVRAINNAAIGGSDSDPVELSRNYATFDLSALSGTISGATLRIYASSTSYNSSAATETLGLYGVSTSSSELMAGNGATDPAGIYTDLGSGTSYGSMTMELADNSSYVEAVLNGDAVAALDAAVGSGTWTVGGALTSIDGSYDGGVFERVLRGTGVSSLSTQLVLTGSIVPEPSTIALLVLGCCGMASLTRRQS